MKQAMRILVAEDNGPTRLALQRILLQWGYEVVVCRDGEAAWSELQKENAPTLAILDWMMPGISGPEICARVREQNREPYTYLLLLTSRAQREDLIAGLESGADDYVTKPFDYSELNVRLRTGVRILELQRELVDARERLREQATRDPLTGLWNRRYIMDMLERERARGVRENYPVGVLMMDVDHFKSINDTYGHLAGDLVLQELAARLLFSVRSYDAVGRYGGEEFMVVLPGCDEEAIQSRAEAMRSEIDSRPIWVDDNEIHVTASFGATVGYSTRSQTLAGLLRAADDALYDAKETGRNRVAFRSCVLVGSC